MFDVKIGDKKVKAEVSFLTPEIYESEFRKDMLQDFFGDVLKMSEQVQVDEEMNIVNIDFARINWMAANRVLWAAVKTADETAPGYRSWAKQAKGVNMWEVRDELASAVADCFFRPDIAETGAEQEVE